MFALGLDIGTTSVSAVAVRTDGSLAGRVTKNHAAAVPNLPAGHAEQSPRVLFETALAVLQELAAGLDDVPACLGLTGQMHGLLLADADLRPLTNLITWQDKRPLEPAGDGRTWLDEFLALCPADEVARTGCTPSAGYLGVTLFALTRQGLLPASAAHALIFADWAAALLTGSPPRTDRTNAASTGLYDLEHDEYSSLVGRTGLNRGLLPPVAAAGEPLGGLTEEYAAKTGLPAGLPVGVALGDHQAAVLGSVPAGEDWWHVNIGTGGQISLPVGSFVRTPGSDTRFLTEGRYLLVGAGFAGGDALAWVRRTVAAWLEPFGVTVPDDDLFATLLRLAEAVPPGCDGLGCEPYFAGTRREPERRGAFHGVAANNFTPGHLLRAVAEGIATAFARFATEQMPAAGPRAAAKIVATGNAIRRNPVLAASLARAFGLPVFVPEHPEEAAFGAALVAGSRLGVWPDLVTASAAIRLMPAARPDDTA